MDAIVSVFTDLPSASSKRDDDFVDRVNSRYSVIILMVFAITVCMHQYVGTPITCWAPVHFTGSHTKYANAYCWVKNTYYLPLKDRIPKEGEPRQTIPYYQWVPFILLGQAMLFYMPSIIWHSFNRVSGVDADNILQAASTFNKTEADDSRQKTLTMIRNQMHRFLSSRKGVGSGNFKDKLARRQCCGRRFGAYLSLLYIITKACYVVVGIGQLFLLDWMLGTQYSVYGFHVMRWMVTDHDWTNSPFVAFPRVTMCDFNVRRLGNVHRYTVQCTLPINLYNEKIFMFLWFWIVIVAAMSIYSLIIWIARAVSVTDKNNYIVGHLKHLKKLDSASDRDRAIRFTRKYLRADGIFLLRLIGHNTNTLTVSEIICALWDSWPDSDNGNTRPAPSIPSTGPQPSAPAADDDDYPGPMSEKQPLPAGPSGAYPPLPEKVPLA